MLSAGVLGWAKSQKNISGTETGNAKNGLPPNRRRFRKKPGLYLRKLNFPRSGGNIGPAIPLLLLIAIILLFFYGPEKQIEQLTEFFKTAKVPGILGIILLASLFVWQGIRSLARALKKESNEPDHNSDDLEV